MCKKKAKGEKRKEKEKKQREKKNQREEVGGMGEGGTNKELK